ncbi:MAG: redoxin domain-containing protein, partial [Verrucomicrobiota bacterium]
MKRILLIMFASLFPFLSNAADKLAVGAAIPTVQCPDQDGQVVDLAKVGGKGYLLVYFYPKASTPGCTKQGCSLRDSWA